MYIAHRLNVGPLRRAAAERERKNLAGTKSGTDMTNFARIFGFSSLAEWARAAHARNAPLAPEEITQRRELIENIRNLENLPSALGKDEDLLISGRMSPKEYKLYIKQKIRSGE